MCPVIAELIKLSTISPLICTENRKGLGKYGKERRLSVLLGQVSVQVLCPFFNCIVWLPGVQLYELFIYFGDETLVQCIIAKYVLPYGWCLFILLMFSLAVQERKIKANITEIQRIMRNFYEQLYAKKFENFGRRHKFLETYILQNWIKKKQKAWIGQ